MVEVGMAKREKVYLKDTELWGDIDHSASEEQFPETYARLDTLTHMSGKKLVWFCSEGHSWESQVFNRTKGNGCPYCSGRMVTDDNRLSIHYPSVALEWDRDRNGTTSPEDVTVSNGRKFWWICDSGHSWQATVFTRTRGHRCPYCSGRMVTDDNRLSIHYPSVALEWDRDRNGTTSPEDVTFGSIRKFWWICDNGHSWQATVNNRTSGKGCPKCAKRTSQIENRFIETFTEQTDFTVTAHGMRLNQISYSSGRSGVEVDIILCRNGHYLLLEYDGAYWHRGRTESDTEKSRLLLSLGGNILHARIRENDLPELDLAHDRFAQFQHDYHATESDSIERTVKEIERWFLEKIGE